jgi:hypothetical protein
MESEGSLTVPRPPLHVEGWLLRHSKKHELSGFVKRWFVLSGHVLEYKFSKVLFVVASLHEDTRALTCESLQVLLGPRRRQDARRNRHAQLRRAGRRGRVRARPGRPGNLITMIKYADSHQNILIQV